MIRRTCWVVCVLLAAGCSAPSHTWSNQDRSMVWSAMVAAANAPEYTSSDPRKRWIVTDNDVDADAERGRIRIHRILTRSLKLPMQVVQHDKRTWFFDIYLLPADTPTVTFDSMNGSLIRVQLLEEADRYFLLVDNMLQQPPH